MTDAELLVQVQIGRAWIDTRQRDRTWPVTAEYLDMILTRLESLLKEKLGEHD